MGEIVRLQKYIAMCGTASRRNAEVMIQNGRVSVNGKRIKEMGVKVEIGADKVSVDGREIKIPQKKYYIMLNKPVGYVSAVTDQFERPTVVDLVKNDIHTRIFPVGRLDYNTEGLLLLTNDGDFSYRVTHPKFRVSKTYIAMLKGGITVSGLQKLRRGVKLDDGFSVSPAKVEIISAENGHVAAEVIIHEGHNRQVRRMFEAVGSEVKELKRVKIGKIELGNLPLGRWRHLTSHEVNYLMNV
jgi:23S rRNA pseudouridine2605 synthase